METFTQKQISSILDKKYNYIKSSFFNLGVSERIVRGKMPTLEMCSERFLRFIRPELFSLFYQNFEVTFDGISELKYKDYISGLKFPSSLNIIKIHPLQGYALIVIEYSLLFFLVDCLFGGACESISHYNSKEFTPIEKRVVSLLLDIFFRGYKRSWESVLDIDLEHLETEINPRMTNISGLSDSIVITKFHVGFGGVDGYFHICMPNSMIDPIRDLLSARVQVGFTDSDDRWHSFLLNEINNIDICVKVFLTSFEVSVDNLVTIEEGDILLFDMPEKATVFLEDIPSFHGNIGLYNNSVSVKLLESIDMDKDFESQVTKENLFKKEQELQDSSGSGASDSLKKEGLIDQNLGDDRDFYF